MRVVRACYGLALLIWAAPAVRAVTVREPIKPEVLLARLLALRQIAQAVAQAGSPPRATRLAGAEVDASHAASMLALAMCCRDRARRRAELCNAILAAGWMLGEVLAARRTVSPGAVGPSSQHPSGRRLARRRDRIATRIVDMTLPRKVRSWVLGQGAPA
jgi:hypothetical protein